MTHLPLSAAEALLRTLEAASSELRFAALTGSSANDSRVKYDAAREVVLATLAVALSLSQDSSEGVGLREALENLEHALSIKATGPMLDAARQKARAALGSQHRSAPDGWARPT